MLKMDLGKVKETKSDEFLTSAVDVRSELAFYQNLFRGKVVLCNCNDTDDSAFWKYFHLNFEKLGLKRLVAVQYSTIGRARKQEYYGGEDRNIGASVRTLMSGNGDFRNQECLDLMSACDVVVTSPPSSLFKDYVRLIISRRKKFLLVGSQSALTSHECFPLLRGNALRLGFTRPEQVVLPDGMFKPVNNLVWYTNLSVNKQCDKLPLHKRYTPEAYLNYDNYAAINVDKIADIPVDYTGVMGVPLAFLYKYNPGQFEIVAPITTEGGTNLIFTCERENEFNRIFGYLFDYGIGVKNACDPDSLQRRKEHVCSRRDTTADVMFFAEYICDHPELIKVALAGNAGTPVDVFFQNSLKTPAWLG